jgi:hypothetical protein
VAHRHNHRRDDRFPLDDHVVSAADRRDNPSLRHADSSFSK